MLKDSIRLDADTFTFARYNFYCKRSWFMEAKFSLKIWSHELSIIQLEKKKTHLVKEKTLTVWQDLCNKVINLHI